MAGNGVMVQGKVSIEFELRAKNVSATGPRVEYVAFPACKLDIQRTPAIIPYPNVIATSAILRHCWVIYDIKKHDGHSDASSMWPLTAGYPYHGVE